MRKYYIFYHLHYSVEKQRVIELLRTLGSWFIILGIYKLLHAFGYLLLLRSQLSRFDTVDFRPSAFEFPMIDQISAAYTTIFRVHALLVVNEIALLLVLAYQIYLLQRACQFTLTRNSTYAITLLLVAVLLWVLSLVLEYLVLTSYLTGLESLRLLNDSSFEELFVEIHGRRERYLFLVGIVQFLSLIALLFGYIFTQDLFYQINLELRYPRLSNAFERFDYVKAGAILQIFHGLLLIVPWNGIIFEYFFVYLFVFFELFLVYGFVTSGRMLRQPQTYTGERPRNRIKGLIEYLMSWDGHT